MGLSYMINNKLKLDVNKLIVLATQQNINLKLYKKRNQFKNSAGIIWDFDVTGGKIKRVCITGFSNSNIKSANIYHGESSKNGIDFKTESELIEFMKQYN